MASAIFLNSVTDQCAAGRANRRSDRSAAWTAAGEPADDCAGASASRGSLTSWRIARLEHASGRNDTTHECEKSFVHNDPFISPLNRASEIMARSNDSARFCRLRPDEDFVDALVENQVAMLYFSAVVNPA